MVYWRETVESTIYRTRVINIARVWLDMQLTCIKIYTIILASMHVIDLHCTSSYLDQQCSMRAPIVCLYSDTDLSKSMQNECNKLNKQVNFQQVNFHCCLLVANLDWIRTCDRHMYCKLIKIQVIFLLLIKSFYTGWVFHVAIEMLLLANLCTMLFKSGKWESHCFVFWILTRS